MTHDESQEGKEMSTSPLDVEANGHADAIAPGQRWALPGPKSDDLMTHLVARMATLEFGMGRVVGSIERLDRQMDDQRTLIQAMGERLDGRIDEVGERIDEMGKRLDGRIDEMGKRLDGRIDEMGKRLDGRIDEVGKRLDGRIDNLAAQVQKLADVVGDLVSWKQRIWGICLAVSGFASITGLLWALVKTIIQPA
ncbi:apolipoprotein A1/A4/E family protein [Pinirhizobacter soli]|uniref:apolipoprotein A1/A4/E family protein n=1 Tax=Pinirhizobacter soli TaxID=2786953 RepID=UPI00202A460D|nr:apolipoprotein A1/A4/E family protein [Pinirhizobacter soli]